LPDCLRVASPSDASAGCTVSRAVDVTGITRSPAHTATGVAARLPPSLSEPRFRLFFCVAATSDVPSDTCRLAFVRLYAGLRPGLSGGSAGLAGLAVCGAPLALCTDVQQSMVGLPTLALLLAQLILDPAFQPAPLVHTLALWIAAAQTQFA
jgi:hypothetical protein